MIIVHVIIVYERLHFCFVSLIILYVHEYMDMEQVLEIGKTKREMRMKVNRCLKNI